MTVLRFTANTIGLLFVPAVIYCSSAFRHGDLNVAYLSKWFWGNYLYMAAPHLLVVFAFLTVSSFSSHAKKVTTVALLILDGFLLLFQLWIWYVVPPHESGLAWVFYIPLWILILLGISTFDRFYSASL